MFAKLGKAAAAAAAIVDAYPMLLMLLDEASNLYLYCIGKSSLGDLLIILPQLYHNLLQNKTDTLKDSVVHIPASQSRSQRVN